VISERAGEPRPEAEIMSILGVPPRVDRGLWGAEAPGTLGGVEASEGGDIEGREAEDRMPLSMTVFTEIPSRIVEASDTGE
jgi:hypothetical protein